jgi:hypothetical protein
MENETPKDQAIRQLIEAVLKRPHMYTGEGRLHTAIIFLSGVSYGLHLGGAEAADEWNDFSVWLTKKRRTPAGCGVFQLIRLACPDDETAFARVSDYWTEYQVSKYKRSRTKKPRGGTV